MSHVTKDDIKKVARLARIEVAEENREKLASQVNSIIGWVEKLQEVNTENVEPLISVHDIPLRLAKDEISDGGMAEDVLSNTKDAKYGYFTVPKVIE